MGGSNIVEVFERETLRCTYSSTWTLSNSNIKILFGVLEVEKSGSWLRHVVLCGTFLHAHLGLGDKVICLAIFFPRSSSASVIKVV